jgi:hypothetical protein
VTRDEKIRRAVARARRALDEVEALLGVAATPKDCGPSTAPESAIPSIVPNDLQRAKARRWLRGRGIGA